MKILVDNDWLIIYKFFYIIENILINKNYYSPITKHKNNIHNKC